MAASLADLFAQQRSNVVEWGEGFIQALYEFPEVPDRFTVEFISARMAPPQGVKLSIRNGLLVTNDTEADTLLLWHDTAPDTVEIQVRKSPAGNASLKVWNVWRVASDVTHAWLGNAAIRVAEDREHSVVELHCSDGEGPPAFDDLVVRLVSCSSRRRR